VESRLPAQAGSFSDSERRVMAAIESRSVADFSGLPDTARRLDAGFLEALIAGVRSDLPPLHCALRILGADITGPLRSLPASRDGPGLKLLFRNCRFDSPIDLSGAEVLTLRMVDCRLPALIGASFTVRADLDLSGSHLAGISNYKSDLAEVRDCAIHLNHARIGGRLLMSASENSRFDCSGSIKLDGARIEGNTELHGARLQGDHQAALTARSAVFGGNLELLPAHGHRCEVSGEVCLGAAEIVGDLDCSGARLVNPGGRALHCEDLVVESVFLTYDESGLRFEADGRLNFLSARVGGGFFLLGATLEPGPDYSGLLSRGGRVAANLRQMRVSNALVLNDITSASTDGGPVRGWFMLGGTTMNTLIDHTETGWPAPGFLDLDGALYERIRHVNPGDLVTLRRRWLKRQFGGASPTAEEFRPQPYEQLTRALRNGGLSREADAIAVEKIRMRLAARVEPPLLRLFPRLLMLISHHGYSTSRALASFAVFVLLGSLMYTVAVGQFDQPFYPFEWEPEPTRYVLPFGLGEQAAPLGCPGLDTLHFALDFALPLINLGQDTFCRFAPNGPMRWLWLILHSLYGLFGAALSAVVVLTLTGLLRRD
jgi:hypothetical protein